MEAIKIFEVYGPSPTYLVRVNDDVYEMNEYVDWSNGVNMYAGTWEEWKERCRAIGRCDNIPIVLVRGWLKRSSVFEFDMLDMENERLKQIG